MRFFVTQPRILLSEFLVARKNDLLGNKNYRKFVIVGAPRTGSNWLVSLFNSHPKIICLGEKYKNLENRTSQQIWDKIFAKRSSRVSFVGFKLLYNHPQDSSDQFVWDRIKQDPDILIIHLHRKNLLKSYVSLVVGNKTGVWIKTDKSENTNLSEKRVLISKEDCINYFHKVSKIESNVDLNYPEHIVINIWYEDLVDNYQYVMDHIFAQMNLETTKVNFNFQKQNPESLKKLIVNYNELELEFRGSKWHNFFE